MTTPYLPSRWIISAADLSDDPDIFPFLAGQSFIQLKAPLWKTNTETSVSGVERRRSLWSYPIWKFKVAYAVLRDAPDKLEIQKMFAFFNMHAGSFKEFFYYDRTDNSATNQFVGVGNGINTTFQLNRTMSVGGITFTEPVRGVSGVPTIYINGTPTTLYTIGSLGSVIFASPPAVGAVITWTGDFFFLCRFTKDQFDAMQMMNGLWSGKGLEFQTVKQ